MYETAGQHILLRISTCREYFPWNCFETSKDILSVYILINFIFQISFFKVSCLDLFVLFMPNWNINVTIE